MVGWRSLMSKVGMTTLVIVWFNFMSPSFCLISSCRYCPLYLGLIKHYMKRPPRCEHQYCLLVIICHISYDAHNCIWVHVELIQAIQTVQFIYVNVPARQESKGPQIFKFYLCGGADLAIRPANRPNSANLGLLGQPRPRLYPAGLRLHPVTRGGP